MQDSPYSPISPLGMEMSPRYRRGVERMIRRELREATAAAIPVSPETVAAWEAADAAALAREADAATLRMADFLAAVEEWQAAGTD